MFLYKELGLEIDDILSRNCLNIFFFIFFKVNNNKMINLGFIKKNWHAYCKRIEIFQNQTNFYVPNKL